MDYDTSAKHRCVQSVVHVDAGIASGYRPIFDEDAGPTSQVEEHGERSRREEAVHVGDRHRLIAEIRLLHGMPVDVWIQRLLKQIR